MKFYQIIFPDGQEFLNIAFSVEIPDTFHLIYLLTNSSATKNI